MSDSAVAIVQPMGHASQIPVVPSVFVYRSSECHVIIVLTGINIPINIDIYNTFEAYFQIFRNFGYKELKNSEFKRAGADTGDVSCCFDESVESVQQWGKRGRGGVYAHLRL